MAASVLRSLRLASSQAAAPTWGGQQAGLPALAAALSGRLRPLAIGGSRGFAAGPPGGADSGAGKAATEAAQETAPAGEQAQQQKERQEQQQQPDAGEPALRAQQQEEAGASGGGPTDGGGPAAAGEQQQQPDSEQQQPAAAQPPPPSFGNAHPELKQYIAQLKSLKGSSTVQRQQIGEPPSLWRQLMAATLGSLLQRVSGEFIANKIEKDFRVEEFLEGAKDAFFTVHQLMAEEDWDSLKGMMSAQLFSAFKDTADAYQAEGLVWRTQLGGEPWGSSLVGMHFYSKEQMEKFDPAIASLAPDDTSALVRPTGMFLVLSVSLAAEQNTTITRRDDGVVVAELKDLRPARWRFATGPLPGDLPVDQLGTSWFLLSI